MLRNLDGEPFDVLLNPLALPSRVNTSALYELALGKLAVKQGKPILVNSYTKKGSSRLKEVMEELEKNGISPTEEVFDPVSGRKLDKPVTTGISYIYKLHHVVASKQSARGTGSYDQNE
jgi:DNA-directed RNA polymerase subunit beta